MPLGRSLGFDSKIRQTMKPVRTRSAHLLRIVHLKREHGGHVEHDLDAAPVREDGVGACQVVDCVQAALVPVET